MAELLLCGALKPSASCAVGRRGWSRSRTSGELRPVLDALAGEAADHVFDAARAGAASCLMRSTRIVSWTKCGAKRRSCIPRNHRPTAAMSRSAAVRPKIVSRAPPQRLSVVAERRLRKRKWLDLRDELAALKREFQVGPEEFVSTTARASPRARRAQSAVGELKRPHSVKRLGPATAPTGSCTRIEPVDVAAFSFGPLVDDSLHRRRIELSVGDRVVAIIGEHQICRLRTMTRRTLASLSISRKRSRPIQRGTLASPDRVAGLVMQDQSAPRLAVDDGLPQVDQHDLVSGGQLLFRHVEIGRGRPTWPRHRSTSR